MPHFLGVLYMSGRKRNKREKYEEKDRKKSRKKMNYKRSACINIMSE